MRETGLPFDDIRNLASTLPEADDTARSHTSQRLDGMALKPGEGITEICNWYSSWSGRSPAVHRGVVTLFAGTHALDERLSDGQNSERLLAELGEISAGNSMLNRLCHQHDLGLKVFDLALQIPVSDISHEAALDEKGCAGTIGFGMEAIAGGADLLCVAALEPDVSTSNLAILSSIFDLDCDALGKVYGFPEDIFDYALAQVRGQEANPLEVLRRLGGRETAALCGAILAARSQHIPVIVDSVAGLAALAILYSLNKDAVRHCMLAQRPGEPFAGVCEQMALSCVFEREWGVQGPQGVAMAGGMVKSAVLALQGA